jgi:ParB-like chromosome segregation protein Spo0J
MTAQVRPPESTAAPYQLLPALSTEQREALRADIAAHGVLVPIVKDEDGATLDGHHREAIARELGIEAPCIIRAGLSESEKVEHVLKLNLLRRQLGPIAWAEAFRKLAANRGVLLGQGQRNDRTSARGTLHRFT